MDIKDLQGKLVAVLGFGLEGRAVANYLLKHGIIPVLFDERPWQEWSKQDQDYIKSLDVNFVFGPGYLDELRGFDVAFRSPGIRITDIERSVPIYGRPETPMNRHATNQHKLILTSQAKWFFEHCPAKIIGVTGTKGKGTTASLIYEIIKANSYKLKAKSYLTGNIGKEQPLEFLDDLKPEDWVVYELSSFQLQDLEQSPHIGVVLMITSEHLDYHKDIEEYIQAKEPIVKYQKPDDFAIVNADYPNSLKIGNQGKGKKLYYSREKNTDCYVEEGRIYAKLNGSTTVEPLAAGGLQLKGSHNLENVCAAILAGNAAGCDFETIKQAVFDFKGLEHRLEFVAEKQGIKFYNDSFSTTPETAIAAIKAFKEPEIVMLGGSSKNSDFTELGKTIAGAKNIKAVILIGEEGGRIKSEIAKAGQINSQILEGAKSMLEIFEQIRPIATKGDVVLLSPACASFGMFKNYKDRGEQFKYCAINY